MYIVNSLLFDYHCSMLVTIYCRVLLYSILLYSLLSYRVLLCNTLLHRIKNKLHQQNVSKSKVLNLLSTAMGLVHEPPLLRGVVNPQHLDTFIWHSQHHDIQIQVHIIFYDIHFYDNTLCVIYIHVKM